MIIVLIALFMVGMIAFTFYWVLARPDDDLPPLIASPLGALAAVIALGAILLILFGP